MQKIAVCTKIDLGKKKQILVDVINFLTKQNKEIFLTKTAIKNLPEYHNLNYEIYDFIKKVDLIITIGGDGTALSASKKLLDLSIPIFGINAGRLGFLAEIQPENFENTCSNLWKGNFVIDERMLLSIKVIRKSKIIQSFRALNEVVITQDSIAKIVELPTMINDIPIANFRADGLIIATPTGSTAHSLSAGGPIVYPKMDAIILTPMSAHSFTQKPIVISPNEIIKVFQKNKEYMLCVTVDGDTSGSIESDCYFEISKYPEKVKFIRLPNENFFNTIRNKLGWGEEFKQVL